jgi:predicted phosphodiesterase
MKTKIQGKIVCGYLERFPKTATKTLADLIYKENEEVFATPETTRSTVRYYRGNKGKKQRELLKDRRFVRENGSPFDTFKKLPEGLVTLEDWGTIKISGTHTVLILSDVHIPFHSKKNLEIALKKGIHYDVDMIILNGDIADHYSQSHWEKDPRRRNFPEEIKTVKLYLEWLRETFPKARILFKMGNHEERYERYMLVKAPDLLGIPEFEFANVFGLQKLNIELISDKKPIKLNELFIIHGHEYGNSFFNPVNPARGLYLRAKTNAICGHYHQASSHSENDLDEKITGTWSMGHLGDPHPKYRPLNKWNFGFAVIETHNHKFFQVNNYKIIDGETYRS